MNEKVVSKKRKKRNTQKPKKTNCATFSNTQQAEGINEQNLAKT